MYDTIPPLEIVSAKDLLTQPLNPIGFTIDKILPHGLFILSGKSKVGKSWLMLDISNCVATGGTLWKFPASQGDVLYLALEDTKSRLQERLNKISATCDLDSPTDIHFVTKVRRLDSGLSEQIGEYLEKYPNTNLIVVDMLQYVRKGSKNAGTYSGDYNDMDSLREIIYDKKLSMIVVSHNHNNDDADPLSRVYGSAGLTGAVDGIFTLEKKNRTGDKAKLIITNRDTESYQFELKFNRQTCRWEYAGEIGENESDADDYLFELIGFLLDETTQWSGTSTELCEALRKVDPAFKLAPIALSKKLMSRQEYLREIEKVDCKFSRSNSTRTITLSRIKDEKTNELPAEEKIISKEINETADGALSADSAKNGGNKHHKNYRKPSRNRNRKYVESYDINDFSYCM